MAQECEHCFAGSLLKGSQGCAWATGHRCIAHLRPRAPSELIQIVGRIQSLVNS